MNIFGRKTLLLAVAAGLGISCASNTYTQKVSEMSRFERLKWITLCIHTFVIPLTLAMAARGELFEKANLNAGCGLMVGSLGGLSAGAALTLMREDAIEKDEAFSWTDKLLGVGMGGCLTALLLAAMVAGVDALNGTGYFKPVV